MIIGGSASAFLLFIFVTMLMCFWAKKNQSQIKNTEEEEGIKEYIIHCTNFDYFVIYLKLSLKM